MIELKNLPLSVYFLPYIIHLLIVYVMSNKKRDKYNRQQLYDIIADNTPNLSKYCEYVNITMVLFWLPLLFSFALAPFISIFKYVSILFFIRSILTSSTILPSCNAEKCTNYNGLYKYILGYCNDKIFSGHVSVCLVLVHIMKRFDIINDYMYIFFILLTVLISIAIIMVRWHYTVDVLLAYIITCGLLYIEPSL